MEDDNSAQESPPRALRDIPATVKDLALAASQQAQHANNLWAVLATVSLVTIPRVLTPPKAGETTADLPLGIGKVELPEFHALGVALLAVVLIGFCSAHTQVVRTLKLVDRAIKLARKDGSIGEGLDIRDVFESLRTATSNRVAPLAQILREEYQFFPQKHKLSPCVMWFTAIYYALLKLLATGVFLILPGWLLVKLYFGYEHFAAGNARGGAWLPWAVKVFAFFGGFVVLQTIIIDIKYAYQAFRKIIKREQLPQ